MNLENMERTTQRSADNPVHYVVSQVQNYFHHLEDHGNGDSQEERDLPANGRGQGRAVPALGNKFLLSKIRTLSNSLLHKLSVSSGIWC